MKIATKTRNIYWFNIIRTEWNKNKWKQEERKNFENSITLIQEFVWFCFFFRRVQFSYFKFNLILLCLSGVDFFLLVTFRIVSKWMIVVLFDCVSSIQFTTKNDMEQNKEPKQLFEQLNRNESNWTIHFISCGFNVYTDFNELRSIFNCSDCVYC